MLPFSSSSQTNFSDFTIEIYLNKPIQIGCIQLKLKFSKDLTQPLELRLFKQKRLFESPGGTFPSKMAADSASKSSAIDSNKHELLFGPADVRDYLDLSWTRTYYVTICSSKLVETRVNLFYLNIRAPSGGSDVSNFLQKVQITVRKYRRTGLENETIERSLMLKKTNFFAQMLEYLLASTVTPANTTSVCCVSTSAAN